MVPRNRVTGLLRHSVESRLVVVLAPAGYGKTTSMLLWEDADERDFVWVQLDRLDDEPVHLLRHLAQALGAVHTIDPAAIDLLWGGRRSIDLELLPALGEGLRLDGPIVLVLDDIQVIESTTAQRCIDSLLAYLPEGSQLALVGHALPNGSLSERRMMGSTFQLGSVDLAMSEDEAGQLFDRSRLCDSTGTRWRRW